MSQENNLSKRALGVMAILLEQSLQGVDTKIRQINDIEKLMDVKLFKNALPDELLKDMDKLPKKRESLIFQRNATVEFIYEIIKKIPGFDKAWDIIGRDEELNKQFKKAKAWSFEERQACFDLTQFQMANHEYLANVTDGRYTEPSDYEREYKNYLDQWSKRNANEER